MKSGREAAGGGAAGETWKPGNKSRGFKSKKRNEKRLGGRGLSLEAFANAKSGPSGYNPALIKKQRELYRNAKFVGKYKRLLKQQDQSGSHLSVIPFNEKLLALRDDDCNGNEIKDEMNIMRNKKRKKKNSLQSLREEFEKKQAEEQKARMEREAILQAKKEERARAEAKRKELKGKMFKKTQSGQPVMKYRIEHLLEGILQNTSK